VTLVKLHGCVSDPGSLVLTRREHISLLGRLGQKLTAIISFVAVRPLLFAGHDLTDPLLTALYDRAAEGVVEHMRRAYAVWPGPTAEMRAAWLGQNMQFLDATPGRFFETLANRPPAARRPLETAGSVPVPEPVPTVPARPPYKFLDFYTAEDSAIFCGRDTEIQVVYRLALSTRVLTLFGPSGAGKTSLLLAGVLPRLEQVGYRSLYIRALSDPLLALRQALGESVVGGSGANSLGDRPGDWVTTTAGDQSPGYQAALAEASLGARRKPDLSGAALSPEIHLRVGAVRP
jgi:hypothetical protein